MTSSSHILMNMKWLIDVDDKRDGIVIHACMYKFACHMFKMSCAICDIDTCMSPFTSSGECLLPVHPYMY